MYRIDGVNRSFFAVLSCKPYKDISFFETIDIGSTSSTSRNKTRELVPPENASNAYIN